MKLHYRFTLLLVLCGFGTFSNAETVQVENATFGCIRDMSPVRGFFVGSLQGNLDEALAVANAGSGTYPVGSLVQLVPGEAMVKREAGFSPATSDWEFFRVGCFCR